MGLWFNLSLGLFCHRNRVDQELGLESWVGGLDGGAEWLGWVSSRDWIARVCMWVSCAKAGLIRPATSDS